MKTVLQRLRHTLLVPAAEYVPAITDALDIIDAALSLPDPLQALADTHAALDLTYENTAPSRSKRMAEAGFTQRDTRLTCDECGKKYTPQMLPIHGCLPDPSAAPVVPQWLPIESAPMNSKSRLVWQPHSKCVFCASWLEAVSSEDVGGWAVFGSHGARLYGITHWMPLPPAPQQGEQG